MKQVIVVISLWAAGCAVVSALFGIGYGVGNIDTKITALRRDVTEIKQMVHKHLPPDRHTTFETAVIKGVR